LHIAKVAWKALLVALSRMITVCEALSVSYASVFLNS